MSRYDLPTFVVAPHPDRTFYLPGNNATVEIRANYLFGKPVLHGHVRVVREDDRSWNFATQRYVVKEGHAISGDLDASGVFRAHIDLHADQQDDRDQIPSNATTDLHFAAYVTDASTGRTEQRRFDLRLASQTLHVYVVSPPEAVGLPQEHYVSITTADGTPVECDVAVALFPVESNKEPWPKRHARALLLDHLHTDPHGLTRLTLPAYSELAKRRPASLDDVTQDDSDPELLITAADRTGHTGIIEQRLHEPTAALRVTTQQTIYRPGEPIVLSIDAAQQELPLTVQTVRSTVRGELLLDTRNVTLSGGHAALTIPTDDRYSGIVFVNVIAVGAVTAIPGGNGNGNEDELTSHISRALLFPRDNNLHVDIRMSAATYKPGAEATAALTVRGPQDADGDDRTRVPSAVGLVAVDQAVQERNRADNDFGGRAPSFFFASRDDSALSAGGFTMPALQQLDMTKPVPDGAQLAGEILLNDVTLNMDTTSNAATGDLDNAFSSLLNRELAPARFLIIPYINRQAEIPGTAPEMDAWLAAQGVDVHALRDPWGRPFTLIERPESQGQMNLVLVSDGPDKQHGTPDDFEVNVASWQWFNARFRQLQHAVDAYHQRTGGYIRSLSDLRPEMQTEGIAFDQWRDPWDQPLSYRFSVQQTRLYIEVITTGDPSEKPRYVWERGPFVLGNANVDYTADLRRQMDLVLTVYTATHPFPRTNAELQSALRRAGIRHGELLDPWRHPLYPTFSSHSFFGDRAHTEVHVAEPGAEPQARTTYTPVTEISDIVDLRSTGPDGWRGTPDDFNVVTFSFVRSQQSAKESSPQRVPHTVIHPGAAGEVSGVVTDPSGATIPEVIVTATELRTRAEFEAQSDREGRYLLGPLPIGTYKLRFHANGFSDLIYDQVIIKSKGTTTVDAMLAVGTTSQAIEVTAQAATVETSSASVVNSQQVMNLPVDKKVHSLVEMAPGLAASPQPSATPRVRDYFPETLLWRPEVITAADGAATLRFPVADNITTWQLSAAASTLQGNTGAGSTQFTTFQPFFAAFDPPSRLTIGDRIALPVTLRNYLDHAVSVEGSITPAPWFRLEVPAGTTTTVPSQQSASPVFRFTALAAVTNAQQEFTAKATDAGDRIARPVKVHPNGLETAVTSSAILSVGDTTLSMTIPADAIAGSTEATLKIYPNLAAHLRDALAAMASYPDGCAEQIMSIAWPSLLLQRYAARLPQGDEKLQRQTHVYLEQAYQNLLANQMPEGGFAYWPRNDPPDIALTAYAVEFLQQAGVFIDVDPSVVNKAVAWLAKEQEKDGRWITADYRHFKRPGDNRGSAMLTASVAAMIAGTPGSEPLMRKALAADQSFVAEFDEPHTLASYALAAIALQDTARSGPAIQRLRAMALSENGGAYWSLETNTPFFGWGRAGRVESSAQVLRALLASDAKPSDDLVARGLLFLDHQQDRQSLWYSTQATARVLDVLAEIALQSPVAPASSALGVLILHLDGDAEQTVPLPAANVDSGPIFVGLGTASGTMLGAGAHHLTLTMPATAGSATAQLVANFYQPWPGTVDNAGVANHERLRLDVGYSTTRAVVGKPITVNAHIERIGFRGYGMLLAEVGLPPGADVDRASLESAMVANGSQLEHYEVLTDRVLLYVSPLASGLKVRFRFSPRFGIDALTAPSSVYGYYNPDARVDLAPTRIQAR